MDKDEKRNGRKELLVVVSGVAAREERGGE